jgi:hypothetical protein
MQKSPPRYVPTLTQVLASETVGDTVPPSTADLTADSDAALKVLPSAEVIAQQLRQQLLVRTRQYMDIELQRRIRETVSQLALEYAYKLYEEIQPQLQSTIIQVVDEAVQQAVAHAANHTPTHVQ